MTRMQSATFHVQLEPEYGWGIDLTTGEKRIAGAKAVAITQQRPKKPRPGTVVIKLTVEIPEGAFLPLRPEAVITIPTSLTDPHPIRVSAGDPTEPKEEQ